MLGNFHALVVICFLFSNKRFQNILSGELSECQMVWNQIMTDILSVLIWFQTVRKGYQQTTKFAAIKERVNPNSTKVSSSS